MPKHLCASPPVQHPLALACEQPAPKRDVSAASRSSSHPLGTQTQNKRTQDPAPSQSGTRTGCGTQVSARATLRDDARRILVAAQGLAAPPVSADALPDFADPPVVETVLGVGFLEVSELTPIQIVRFWSAEMADELPDAEERPAYEAPVEQFPTPLQGSQISMGLRFGQPPSRFWFSDGSHLVQVQPDWFAYNWRKTRDRPDYERYETGRECFEKYLDKLGAFLARELSINLQPTQCEITYVNHVHLTKTDVELGPLGVLLRDVQPKSGRYLPSPNHAEFSCTYEMHMDSSRGRLHMSARTVVDPDSDELMVNLTLTARSDSRQRDLSQVLRFLDYGRECIVQGFVDLTAPEMHTRWGHMPKGVI